MSDLIAAGWGTDDASDVEHKSDILKEVKIKERTLDEWCPDLYGDDSFSSKIQICAIGFRKSLFFVIRHLHYVYTF